jgi:hypothetical protein
MRRGQTPEQKAARREARERRMADAERMRLLRAAVTDEMVRFNDALIDGATVVLTTFSGRYVVGCVTPDWMYVTHPEGQPRTLLNRSSWAGCNDGTWADLLRQAGVPRNPLFLDAVCNRPDCTEQEEHYHRNEHGFPHRFRPATREVR